MAGKDRSTRKGWPHYVGGVRVSEFPRKDEQGRTVWACCVSSIGPTCRHVAEPSDGAKS